MRGFFSHIRTKLIDEILPIEIPPNDSVEMTITFEPFEEGMFTDKINFRSVTDTLLIAQQVFVEGTTYLVSVGEEINGAFNYSLSQNYTNPFNPVTTIKYKIPELSTVILKIYDVLGNEIETLVRKEKPIGSYAIIFNATSLPSGVYFYRLQAVPNGRQAGSFIETKRMILLK